ncbi:MAG: glycerophosphodiester phosphodiesterase [Acidimicrobiia bacterium]|nr:glycerophosphodiester phosphodiesterase [Acidimicrobiia bacterium]
MLRTPYGPGPLVYAHRGDSAHAHDNSIEAFTLAIEAGADGIETDVRRSSDGHLILSHDATHPTLGALSKCTLDEIRDMDDRIPTLREGLSVIPRTTFVNVEIKNHRMEPGFDAKRTIVDETIAELENYDDSSRILVSSFDPFAVGRARQIAPAVATGLLVTGHMLLGVATRWARRAGHKTVNLAASHLVEDPRGVVNMAEARGLGVVAWTIDDPNEIERLFRHGVIAIVTNDPGAGRAVVDSL